MLDHSWPHLSGWNCRCFHSKYIIVMALNPVSIPLIITKDQKQQLLDLGYTKSKINKMKPEEAHKILGIELQNNSIPVLPDPGPEIPGKFLPLPDQIEIPQHPEA